MVVDLLFLFVDVVVVVVVVGCLLFFLFWGAVFLAGAPKNAKNAKNTTF